MEHEEKSIVVSLKLPEALMKEAVGTAHILGESPNGFIRAAAEAYLQQHVNTPEFAALFKRYVEKENTPVVLRLDED